MAAKKIGKEEIIRIEDFSIWFEGQDKPALSHINLSVNKAESILVMGPSGSGKSILFLSIMGIIPHTVNARIEGHVYVRGEDVQKKTVADMSNHVGLIFQDPGSQLCELIVEDEVAFGPSCAQVPAEEMVKRVDECLRLTEIAKYKLSEVHRLSGGEKQRLALSSVLAMHPEILLLDGPTSNLDPVGVSLVLETMDRLRKETDLTLLTIEPETDVIIDKVDRLILMNEGKIIDDGNPREIFRRNGLSLRNDLGLWLPQVTEITLELREAGIDVASKIPLTVDEFLRGAGPTKPVTVEFPEIPHEKPILTIDNVSFAYKTGKVEALKGISCEIYQGDFMAIVGQNGSGKTTLALNISGLLNPTSGKILFEGTENTKIKKVELGQKIGYVFQYPDHQFAGGTIYDELAWPLKIKGVPENEIKEIVLRRLKEIGLKTDLRAHPYALSMGEKRRLSVEMVLLRGPKMMILDEPTFGQDWNTSRRLMERLQEVHRQGCTILMITHNMKLVAEYANRVVALSGGKIIYDGPTHTFFQNTEVCALGHLKPPAVVELSRRIGNPKPLSLTIQQFEEAYKN